MPRRGDPVVRDPMGSVCIPSKIYSNFYWNFPTTNFNLGTEVQGSKFNEKGFVMSRAETSPVISQEIRHRRAICRTGQTIRRLATKARHRRRGAFARGRPASERIAAKGTATRRDATPAHDKSRGRDGRRSAGFQTAPPLKSGSQFVPPWSRTAAASQTVQCCCFDGRNGEARSQGDLRQISLLGRSQSSAAGPAIIRRLSVAVGRVPWPHRATNFTPRRKTRPTSRPIGC